MNKRITALAALVIAPTAMFAAFEKVTDFQDGSTADWTTSVSNAANEGIAGISVIDDPISGGDNKVLWANAGDVLEAGTNLRAQLPIPSIAFGTEATIFFRVSVPTVTLLDNSVVDGVVDTAFGVTSVEEAGSYSDYQTPIRFSVDDTFDAFDGAPKPDDATKQIGYTPLIEPSGYPRDEWVSVWVHVKNIDNEQVYQTYFQYGDNAQVAGLGRLIDMRNKPAGAIDAAAAAIDNFLITTSAGNTAKPKGLDPTYFDDIYVDTTGLNLDSPVDGPVDVVAPKLINISTRGKVGAAVAESLIGGFVIEGDKPMQVLIQAVGSELKDVPGTDLTDADLLANPVMIIQSSDGSLSVTNDNWEDAANSADTAQAMIDAGANVLPTGSQSSSALLTLEPGAYTAIVSGGGTEGIALVEVYEVSSD